MIENNLDKIGSYNAHFLEESRKKNGEQNARRHENERERYIQGVASVSSCG